MRKRTLIIFWTIFILITTIYFSYESQYTFSGTLSYYLSGYLTNPQKQLFLLSMYILPFIQMLHIPYLEAMFMIRIKRENMYAFAAKCIIKSSVITTVWIAMLFLIPGLIIIKDKTLEIGDLTTVGLLYTYALFCCITKELLYIATQKAVFSIIIIIAANFAVIAGIYGMTFAGGVVYGVGQTRLVCMIYELIFIVLAACNLYVRERKVQ